MKNVKTLSTAFLSALLFFACKKDPGNSGSSALYRPKTYTETITSTSLGNSSTTYNLTYDGNNRIISLAAASGTGNKFVYQYNSNNTYTMDLYNSNVLSIHEVFFINSLSFVDSTFQYNDTNDSTTEKYFYNANKQLIKVNQYDYTKATGGILSDTHNYTYDNAGNVIKDADINSTLVYAYGDLRNPLSLGQLYLPVNPNLPKMTTLMEGGITIINTQTYTFDSNNRLISEKDVLSTGDVFVKSYTY